MHIKSNWLLIFLLATSLLLSSCNETTPLQPEINQPETEQPVTTQPTPDTPSPEPVEHPQPLEAGEWEDMMPPPTNLSKVLGITLDKQDRPVIAYSKVLEEIEGDWDVVGSYVARWENNRLQTFEGDLEGLPKGDNFLGFFGVDYLDNPIFAMRESYHTGGYLVSSDTSIDKVSQWSSSGWQTLRDVWETSSRQLGSTPVVESGADRKIPDGNVGVDRAGHLIVFAAKYDRASNQTLYSISRENAAGIWEQITTEATSAEFGSCEQLVFDTQNNPFLLCNYFGDATYKPYKTYKVFGWDGNTWKKFGDSILTDTNFNADVSSLVIDKNGHPLVILNGIHNDAEITYANSFVYVQRWDGNAWQQLGGTLNITDSTGAIAFPNSLVFDKQGQPVVLIRQSLGQPSFAYTLYLKRWNGTDWELLGDSLTALEGSSIWNPFLTLDSKGQFVAAWTEQTYQAEGWRESVHVKRYTLPSTK